MRYPRFCLWQRNVPATALGCTMLDAPSKLVSYMPLGPEPSARARPRCVLSCRKASFDRSFEGERRPGLRPRRLGICPARPLLNASVQLSLPVSVSQPLYIRIYQDRNCLRSAKPQQPKHIDPACFPATGATRTTAARLP